MLCADVQYGYHKRLAADAQTGRTKNQLNPLLARCVLACLRPSPH
jgi:hypothetical protein